MSAGQREGTPSFAFIKLTSRSATSARNPMSTRYATIITDDDGREVVSAIGQFEGAAPDLSAGRVEAVGAGVLIGMVRGGPVDAAGGFGFPLGSSGVNDSAIGLAMLEKARSEKREAMPAGAVPSGVQEPHKAKPASAKPARAKAARRKKAGRRRKGTARAPGGPAHG
jgi:hypothetical protein